MKRNDYTLYPQRGVRMKISLWKLILMSFLFFLIAFLLGSAMRHYPTMAGVV